MNSNACPAQLVQWIVWMLRGILAAWLLDNPYSPQFWKNEA